MAFSIYLSTLDFKASVHHGKLSFTARAVAHEACVEQALGKSMTQDESCQTEYFYFYSKGYDCGFSDSRCPFCNEELEEGTELYISPIL